MARYARLRASCHRIYPALDGARWYRILGQEPATGGLWLENAGGDPFVTQGRRYVFGHHFEVREE